MNTTPTAATVGQAARALADTVEAAHLPRTIAGDPALEPVGDLYDLGDGTWGMLAVLDGCPVRVTVEAARPEEAQALDLDVCGTVADADLAGHLAGWHGHHPEGVYRHDPATLRALHDMERGGHCPNCGGNGEGGHRPWCGTAPGKLYAPQAGPA